MMKGDKIGIVLTLALALSLAFVSAQGMQQAQQQGADQMQQARQNGSNDTAMGPMSQNDTQPSDMQNQAEQRRPSQARIGGQEMGPPENVSQHLAEIQQRIEEKTNKTVEGLTQAQEAVRTGQRIRSSVSALVQAGNFSGDIGDEVSQIARSINDSRDEIVESESEVRKGGVAQFLFGGNQQAAENLNENARQNLQRVQELQTLIENCTDCSGEVRDFMRNKSQELQQENERLQELAEQEMKSKGIFGWLWK